MHTLRVSQASVYRFHYSFIDSLPHLEAEVAAREPARPLLSALRLLLVRCRGAALEAVVVARHVDHLCVVHQYISAMHALYIIHVKREKER